MRYLILAQGGVDARWQNPDGTPWLGITKHLLPVDGETLLGRTVRLLKRRGARDIVITGPEDDPRYRFAGVRTVQQDQSGWTWPGINALHGTRELWAPRSRTTLLFGDVFYTDEAMDLIVACDEPDLHFYRRPTASALTAHPWDEPFGMSFMPEHHDRIVEVGARIAADWTGVKRPHLWHFHAAWHSLQVKRARDLVNAPGQTVIDDWTDDIDKPSQAVAWLGRYYSPAAMTARGVGPLDVAVVMPWRNMGCPIRKRLAKFCKRWWQDQGVDVIVASDDDAPHFNVSQARNRGAAQSDADVLVFVDADTLVTPDQFWAGCYLAQQSGQVVLPYSEHRRLDSHATQQVIDGGWPKDAGRVWNNHVSGVVIVPREAWERVRFDERFVGWGAEDRAFWAAACTLLGEHDRLPGASMHLWHPKSPDRAAPDDDPRRAANLELGRRYKLAAGMLDKTGWLPQIDDGGRVPADPVAMTALLAEPGGPFAT